MSKLEISCAHGNTMLDASERFHKERLTIFNNQKNRIRLVCFLYVRKTNDYLVLTRTKTGRLPFFSNEKELASFKDKSEIIDDFEIKYLDHENRDLFDQNSHSPYWKGINMHFY